MLTTLIPDDDIENETDEQERVRVNIAQNVDNDEQTEPFDPVDLQLAIEKTKHKTAPGNDDINPELITQGGAELHAHLLNIYNACLRLHMFPKAWKKGLLFPILKAPNRDPNNPNSYRPICLLPVLGKILERLILSRLEHRLEETFSDAQFGFRPSRSTEDAITKLQDTVRNSEAKYVLGIFVDIEGAFNNVWWPLVLHALKEINCPIDLYKLIKDYFTDREVIMRNSQDTKSKRVTKGCPQGSVLGPKFWNIIFDKAIRAVEEAQEATVVAYADDIAFLIESDGRRGLERKGTATMLRFTNWCKEAKLKISREKTKTLLLKGKLNIRRPPTIRAQETNLRNVQGLRYLGIELQAGNRLENQVNKICNTAVRLFHGLGYLSGLTWGYKFTNYKRLYRAIFESIIGYAANGWAPYLLVRHKNKLISAQRKVLLKVTRAYSTISNNALHIIAGEIPADLFVEERVTSYKLRKKLPTRIGETEINAHIYNTRNNKELHSDLRKHTLALWDDRWKQSTKGLITKDFFPSAKERVRQKHIKVDYATTQFFSGHGYFTANLFRFKLAEDYLCYCEDCEPDTMYHALYTCPRYREARRALRQVAIQDQQTWPPDLQYWTTKTAITAFQNFATTVIGIRKQQELDDAQN